MARIQLIGGLFGQPAQRRRRVTSDADRTEGGRRWHFMV